MQTFNFPSLVPQLAIFLCLLFSGCLPSGCERDGYTELTPADSLSRQIAAATPTDTLELVWSATGGPEAPLEFPRTVRFGLDGRLFVSDVERDGVFVFTPEGRFVREVTDETLDVPFLAGLRGDTLVVLTAGTDALAFVHAGRVVRRLPLPFDREGRSSLIYAAATDTALYAKLVGEEVDNVVVRLDARGAVAERVPLPGPHWRHAGMLRPWGDSLLSLSGFRPVVDVVPLPMQGAARVDTMALRGFDSPMLARSRAFLVGDVSTAPLLTAAAAPAGDALFALNLRPRRIQVDVYDRAGRLQRRLVTPDGADSHYPRDVDVRWRDGGYDIAVVLTDPAPRLDLYRWVPGE